MWLDSTIQKEWTLCAQTRKLAEVAAERERGRLRLFLEEVVVPKGPKVGRLKTLETSMDGEEVWVRVPFQQVRHCQGRSRVRLL